VLWVGVYEGKRQGPKNKKVDRCKDYYRSRGATLINSSLAENDL
jgi:hypothetical protein